MKTALLFFGLILGASPGAAAAQLRGDAASVAAAEKLLDRAGGSAVWANARTFYVEERIFLQSGEVAQLKIWRDLHTGSRRLERAWPGGRYLEWLSPAGGHECAMEF